MTDSDIIKYTYKKPTKVGDEILEMDRKLDIHKNDLLTTLKKNGQDFIDYGPIDIIEKFFEQYANVIKITEYLNNFDLNVKQAVQNKLIPVLSKLDPTTEIYGESMGESDKLRHSQKQIQQTISEFRQDIRNAITACNMDIKRLQEIYGREKEEGEKGSYLERREYVYKKIRPVYIQLRKEGYTSYDLTY